MSPTPQLQVTKKSVRFSDDSRTHHYLYRCGGTCQFSTTKKIELWTHVKQHTWLRKESDADLLLIQTDKTDEHYTTGTTVAPVTTTTTSSTKRPARPIKRPSKKHKGRLPSKSSVPDRGRAPPRGGLRARTAPLSAAVLTGTSDPGCAGSPRGTGGCTSINAGPVPAPAASMGPQEVSSSGGETTGGNLP